MGQIADQRPMTEQKRLQKETLPAQVLVPAGEHDKNGPFGTRHLLARSLRPMKSCAADRVVSGLALILTSPEELPWITQHSNLV